MRCVEGAVYRPGEGLARGWLLVEGGRVVDEGEGRPPRPPDARGLVLPAPVNAHTHVGDFVGRSLPLAGRSLAQVVKPPDGLKHRLLRETPRDKLVAGMREAIAEMRAAGTRAFLDFREQGVDGVRMLAEAASAPRAPRALILGRAGASWDDAEADAVARAADGIGLPSLSDVPPDVPKRAAHAARRHKKRFALHFSEEAREDAGRALDLAPDLLVHVVASPREDLRAIADARVPVVLCPRSNARWGRAPDARAMLELGIPFALGSDNAMLHALDVLLDARHFARAYPDLPPETWLDAAIAGGARVLDGAPPRAWLRRGETGALVVLAGDGLDAVFGPAAPRAVMAV